MTIPDLIEPIGASDERLYDDDVGGPAYVGGVDGIELAPLAAEEDRRAKG